MRKGAYHSERDENRRKMTRALMGSKSLPAFSFDYRVDRKTLIAVMNGSKPFTDAVWSEICDRTGMPVDGGLEQATTYKPRTEMERIQVLDELIGGESVEQYCDKKDISPSYVHQFFSRSEHLDVRHAMKLADMLGLPKNYFEITPILNPENIQRSPQDYKHRIPQKYVSEKTLANRVKKLRLLVGKCELDVFCQVFNVDQRRLHGVLHEGLSMDKSFCRKIAKSLKLTPDFFDNPVSDIDTQDIESVKRELESWPAIAQLRKLGRDAQKQVQDFDKRRHR